MKKKTKKEFQMDRPHVLIGVGVLAAFAIYTFLYPAWVSAKVSRFCKNVESNTWVVPVRIDAEDSGLEASFTQNELLVSDRASGPLLIEEKPTCRVVLSSDRTVAGTSFEAY